MNDSELAATVIWTWRYAAAVRQRLQLMLRWHYRSADSLQLCTEAQCVSNSRHPETAVDRIFCT